MIDFVKRKSSDPGHVDFFDGTLPGWMENRKFEKNFWMWAGRRNETGERKYWESKELSKNIE